MEAKEPWRIDSSKASKGTLNAISMIIDDLTLLPNPTKKIISLSIGDPTRFGNFPIDPVMEESLHNVIDNYRSHGYSPSMGNVEAREAIAKYYTSVAAPLTSNDVILTNGCSGAVDIAISVLCNPGDNILIPRPGFSLYRTIAGNIDIETKDYDLLPERNWEADLDKMEELIDDRTRWIVVVNPSNPCGSVYTRDHLKQIAKIAARHHLPILADEIYGDMVFSGDEYCYMADVTQDVPILSCGGMSKRFLAPGWRIGWLLVHDRHNAFQREIRQGIKNLTTKLLGPNSIIEAALPEILENIPKHFFDKTLRVLKTNADILYSRFQNIQCLTPIMPTGAMYMMCGIDVNHMEGIDSDMQFVQTLMAEESVFCLPGKCFQYPDYFRVCLCVPTDKTEEAADRIQRFCERHYRVDNNII